MKSLVSGAPPDVRDRCFEDDPVLIDEERVVDAEGDRVLLRHHVLGVARRLRPRERAARRARDGEPQASCSRLLEARVDRTDGRDEGRRRPGEAQRELGSARGVDRERREQVALRYIRFRYPHLRRGRAQPFEVRVELERTAAVHAGRLEDRSPPQEHVVTSIEHGLARIDEAAAGDGNCEQIHATARRGRALTHDSSISASASEPHVMPPPTQR